MENSKKKNVQLQEKIYNYSMHPKCKSEQISINCDDRNTWRDPLNILDMQIGLNSVLFAKTTHTH